MNKLKIVLFFGFVFFAVQSMKGISVKVVNKSRENIKVAHVQLADPAKRSYELLEPGKSYVFESVNLEVESVWVAPESVIKYRNRGHYANNIELDNKSCTIEVIGFERPGFLSLFSRPEVIYTKSDFVYEKEEAQESVVQDIEQCEPEEETDENQKKLKLADFSEIEKEFLEKMGHSSKAKKEEYIKPKSYAEAVIKNEKCYNAIPIEFLVVNKKDILGIMQYSCRHKLYELFAAIEELDERLSSEKDESEKKHLKLLRRRIKSAHAERRWRWKEVL